MILAKLIEEKQEALRVAEVARILDVSIKKIYRMAAKGQIPSLKISSSIRFDPQDVAAWLRSQQSTNPIAAIPLPRRTPPTRSTRQRDHTSRIWRAPASGVPRTSSSMDR
jgi:excisionase family DNA binding protein